MPFQARANDGYIENGGDLEESDIEYDHNNGGAGGKRSSGNRNHSRKGKRSTNRPGASGPDQYRYDILRKYHLSRQHFFLYIFKEIIWHNSCISYCIAFQTILLTATIATSLH